MINWRKYFNNIYCLNYIPNGRLNSAFSEQTRVGMHNDPYMVRFSFQTSSPVFDRMIHLINDDNKILPHKNARCTYGHYFMIREAYELGYERVLFIEDDVRFLKDVDMIEHVLDNLNFDTDPELNAIMYDWCLIDKEYDEAPVYVLASCYALTRHGMKYFIENYETEGKEVCDIDQNFCETDFMNMNGSYKKNTSSVNIHFKVSTPRICVQAETSKYATSIYDYDENKIDFSLYNF